MRYEPDTEPTCQDDLADAHAYIDELKEQLAKFSTHYPVRLPPRLQGLQWVEDAIEEFVRNLERGAQ